MAEEKPVAVSENSDNNASLTSELPRHLEDEYVPDLSPTVALHVPRYDWANSVYYNTVLQSFLPGFITLIAQNVEGDDHKIPFIGSWRISGSSYYTSVVPVSILFQLIFFILFGTVGDFGSKRKFLLVLSSLIGSISTCFFVAVPQNDFFWIGGLLMIVSNVALGFSVIVYNAYLPILVENTPEVKELEGCAEYEQKATFVSQKISNVGFVVGYSAGVTLLLLNIVIAIFTPASGRQWCRQCPSASEWEAYNYRISNSTLAEQVPAAEVLAWPGLYPPCLNLSQPQEGDEEDDVQRCLLRYTAHCNASGCELTNDTCTPNEFGICTNDTFTCLNGASETACDEYGCTSDTCHFFRCSRDDCPREYDHSESDLSHIGYRLNLMSGGLWWTLFSIIAFVYLKKRPSRPLEKGKHYVLESLKRIKTTLKKARKLPETFKFLVAFWLYSDGYNTIGFGAIIVAVEKPLFFGGLDLGILLLETNLTALLGNIFYVFLARKLVQWQQYREKKKGLSDEELKSVSALWTNIVVISINLFFIGLLPLWAMPGVGLLTRWEFYTAAGLYGLQIGAVQAFSRSLLSELTPDGCESEFFSLFELSDKGTSWFGPILFTIVNEVTGNPRWAILSILIYVALGFAVLMTVKTKKGRVDAQRFHIVEEVKIEEETEKVTKRESQRHNERLSHHHSVRRSRRASEATRNDNGVALIEGVSARKSSSHKKGVSSRGSSMRSSKKKKGSVSHRVVPQDEADTLFVETVREDGGQ